MGTLKTKEKLSKHLVYAVYGLTEWDVLIPAGKGSVRVKFTGGSLTGYGVVPATFTTDDLVLAALIENSPQFQSKRIVRL